MPARKSNEDFLKEVSDKVGDEYEFIDKYINNKTKLKVKHKCGYEYSVTPHNFLCNNSRCPKCSGRYKRSHEDFIKEVYNLVGNEYEVLSKYISDGTKNSDKILFYHKKCKSTFRMRAHDFLKNNNRCPKCSLKKAGLNRRKSHEEFLNEVKSLVGDEYEVLSKYNQCRDKILIRHNKCNNLSWISAKHFLYDGTRCPACNTSKGENRIKQWLDDNNYNYETQFSFSDCKNKLPLRFDFKINLNDNNFVLLEYDGVQHFNETWYDNLSIQQRRDSIKDNYCKEKNIKLIRIKYTDYDNIENILKENLKNEK
jgi:hypothetical protein